MAYTYIRLNSSSWDCSRRHFHSTTLIDAYEYLSTYHCRTFTFEHNLQRSYLFPISNHLLSKFDRMNDSIRFDFSEFITFQPNRDFFGSFNAITCYLFNDEITHFMNFCYPCVISGLLYQEIRKRKTRGIVFIGHSYTYTQNAGSRYLFQHLCTQLALEQS